MGMGVRSHTESSALALAGRGGYRDGLGESTALLFVPRGPIGMLDHLVSHRDLDPRRLVAPAIGAGVFMAAYLLTRPYGDKTVGATPAETAAAFASPWWVAAHVFGMLALASFARLALRASPMGRRTAAAVGRTTGLVGVVIVLPYFGAETFALHAVGQRAVAGDPGVLELVTPIREQPVAMAMFGLGLVLLGVSGIAVARALIPVLGRAAWPLGVLMALLLPQFFLPPTARMLFGLAVLAAAMVVARAAWSASGARRDHQPAA